ncbi:MAG: hypothetical protein LBE12_13030 [Planctomycetaceae bacterium]|nr:hypothetical protein [Planctomycetaceae bacterium]
MSYDPNPYAQNESHLGWYMFFVIDFPLGLLFHPIGILLSVLFHVLSPLTNNYYWDCVILPACLFQILGWLNWTMIWFGVVQYARQKSTGACPKDLK